MRLCTPHCVTKHRNQNETLVNRALQGLFSVSVFNVSLNDINECLLCTAPRTFGRVPTEYVSRRWYTALTEEKTDRAKRQYVLPCMFCSVRRGCPISKGRVPKFLLNQEEFILLKHLTIYNEGKLRRFSQAVAGLRMLELLFS